jgi:hypothetical protein
MGQRYQISLRNILIAMAWFSVASAAFVLFRKYWRDEPFPPDEQWANIAVLYVLIFVVICSPCVAIGALLGRSGRGIGAGIALFIAFYLFALAWVARMGPLISPPIPAPTSITPQPSTCFEDGP